MNTTKSPYNLRGGNENQNINAKEQQVTQIEKDKEKRQAKDFI